MPELFSDPLEGIYGVGFGFSDAGNLFSFNDRVFWYFGEPCVFHVPAQPARATEIARLSWTTIPAAWGLKYYQTPEPRYYILDPSGSWWRILPMSELMGKVDAWRRRNFVGAVFDSDVTRCGFLYLGVEYWRQRYGSPFIPSEFQNAILRPYDELGTILKYIPKTTAMNTGADISVGLPRLGQSANQGIDLYSLARLLGLGQRRKKSTKRNRRG